MLAFGALGVVIWKGKNWKQRGIGIAIVVAVFGFLPVKMMIEKAQRDAFAREAWAYFKKKCDTEAGEKIYKTYTGVKSVLVVKPLPPATEKDLYDQYWYGDPYSAPAHSQRGKLEAITLASRTAPVAFGIHGHGYEFVELREESSAFVKRYYYLQGEADYKAASSESVASRFGVSWEDISTPEDRRFWVAGSRLRIVDLTDNTTVAERIGFLVDVGFGSTAGHRRPWLASRSPGSTCPPIRNGSYEDRWFVLKVLNPDSGISDGK